MDENNNGDSLFIKKYPLIFKKYRPLKKLGKGAFSEIYFGINIYTEEKIALKIEKKNLKVKYLDTECYILFSLKGIGIPKVISFGHNKEYDILIMPLLGKSLQELYISKNLNFEFIDICLMGIQIIDRIQWVHYKKIIHRDIKPDNFLIGLNDPNIIYLIDFGLSKKYKSSQTGKHIKLTDVKKFTGNIRYASVNSLKLKEQSRRDDLESIGYMLIYFMKGALPWMGIKIANKKELYLKMAKFKKEYEPEQLCENLPREFVDYVKYVKNLEFEENPDYNYIKSLFEKMIKKKEYDEKNLYFSWINTNRVIGKIKPFNLSKRKSCPKERLLYKIKKNLDDKKSYSEMKIINCINNLNEITSETKLNNNIKVKKNADEESSNNKFKNNLNNAFNQTTCSQINYVNNSINNNFISISVSFPNNPNTNKRSINPIYIQNFNRSNNNINNENNKEIDYKPFSIINLNKSKKINNNKIKTYNDKNNSFPYQQISPSFTQINDFNKTTKIDTNSSIIFNKINNNYYNNNISNNKNNSIFISSQNFYNNKAKQLINNKKLYEGKKKYYNTNDNNSNTQKFFKANNNNKKYIQIWNNTFYNSPNMSYTDINGIKNNKDKKNLIVNKSNNNIKIINKKTDKKNIIRNFNSKNIINRKLIEINPFYKKPKTEIQNNSIEKNINPANSELINELKRFNIRYNINEFLNDKNLFKNKVKCIKHPKMVKTNQSADHNKLKYFKNSKNKLKYKSNNNENNCNIY